MIIFKEITNANIWKVCSLELFEDQKDFVAENIQSLAEAYATRNEGNNALPLAVYNDEDLNGSVFLLRFSQLHFQSECRFPHPLLISCVN